MKKTIFSNELGQKRNEIKQAHEELEFLWEKECYLENRTIKGINNTIFRGLAWNPKAVYPDPPKTVKKVANTQKMGLNFYEKKQYYTSNYLFYKTFRKK